MNTYKIVFYGRLNGAIGARYFITEIVQADTKEEARLKLYDKYEHIHVESCTKL